MSFFVANGLGDHIKAPSVDQMHQLLADGDTTDEEHGAAWLSIDGGHSLEWSGAAGVFSVPGGPSRARDVKPASLPRLAAEHAPMLTRRTRPRGQGSRGELGRVPRRECGPTRQCSWYNVRRA
jgi:hypothetical protein